MTEASCHSKEQRLRRCVDDRVGHNGHVSRHCPLPMKDVAQSGDRFTVPRVLARFNLRGCFIYGATALPFFICLALFLPETRK